MVFKGYAPAIVTPFTKSGKVNYNVFKKLIDFQIENGARAIVFLGTTGESATLTQKEREEVVEFAVEYVDYRVPVIVGAGSNCTKTAIEKSRKFEKLGADCLLHVTPYYNKCTQNGLIEHYTAIAKSVSIPIILYSVPSRTGVNIQPETVKVLSEIDNIVGIKEASGNISQISEIRRLCDEDFAIYSGDDGLTVPILSVGGAGVISVVGNALPKYMTAICDNYFLGNIDYSRELQLALNPLIKLMFAEVNPIPIKYAMKLVGFDCGIPKLPLTEATNPIKIKIRNMIKEFL